VSPDQNPAAAGTVPTATMSQRMRRADRLANALVNALTHGWRVDLSDHDADLNTEPILHPILDQAPRVAAGIDPHAVRLARTARGAVLVIRLHGPDWSLVMTASRPLPAHLLAVHDQYHDHGTPYAVNLLDPLWLPELRTMCDGIHAALAQRP
jgi:hypothetical protein